jgi:hypothetical protein
MTQLCIDKEISEFGCNAISWGLYISYIIFGVAVLAAIVLPLINTVKNPSSLIKSGIGVGILVVVFIVSYVIADSELSAIGRGLGVTESSVKWIGAGLIMFYIALFVAIGGLLYSEISKAFK